jgi:hypothetical protein
LVSFAGPIFDGGQRLFNVKLRGTLPALEQFVQETWNQEPDALSERSFFWRRGLAE